MDASTVRMNITLPKEIAQELSEITGSRKRSSFIAEAIKQRIAQQKKEKMNKLLEEGYKATAKEDMEITKDFEAVDLEGWDEY